MEKPLALIIEDDRDIAALYRHVIDMAGYRTEVTLHGKLAVERLSNSQPDLVILDLNLPGVSGSEILKMIRKDKRLRETKVIVITAYPHIAESLSMEPDLILFKPIGIEQLSDLIERFHLKVKYQTTIPMKDEPWDRVTGLYNQFFFRNRLHFALSQSKEIDRYLFAVISINLDPNNSVKDQLNIKRWISSLRETAKVLKTLVGPPDTVARFDQDNFYVLLESVPDRNAPMLIASRIHKRLNQDLANLGDGVDFPIRMGILLCDRRYQNVEQILHDANTAQSLANAQGDVFYNYLDRAAAHD
jgi:diguanylate cyclase (GGDEF)-like protein